MIRMSLCTVVALIVTIGAQCVHAKKPDTAVMPLTAKGVDKTLVAVLDGILVSAVMQSGRYHAIGKSDIEALLGLEKAREVLAYDGPTCLSDIGNVLGVPFLITGSVGKLGEKKIVLTLQLLDVQNSKSVNTISHTANSDPSALDVELQMAVAKLVGSKPPTVTTPVETTRPLPSVSTDSAVAKAAGEYAETITRDPKRLRVRATGQSMRGEAGSLMRLNWSKKKVMKLVRDEALNALQLAPYALALDAAQALVDTATQEYEIDDDGSVTLTLDLHL
ncbi:MAG: hypothetical protein A2289_12330 [Deltaproteobacteria bacterium RIFOXYA12_FULL_58_15]|nr:MAG: hypothetical protein A2289_12330 [Deltaproteobacteria bacterium RIFOXYA12_FULL_58_15]